MLKAVVRRVAGLLLYPKVWVRVLLWALIFACLLSGIATYAISPRYLSLFLISNGTFLLLLIGLVLHKVGALWLERRQNLAGSKLHARVLGVFSLLVVTPTVLVAIFSVLFVHMGMQAWFNDKVQTALQESQRVASAYLKEHQKVIAHSVQAMERDLEQILEDVLEQPELLDQYLTTQARLRSLSEAIIFSGSGKVLGRSQFSFSLEFEGILSNTLEAAEKSVVIYPNQRNDRVIALVQISKAHNLYLLVSHLVEKQVLKRIALNKEAVDAYEHLLEEREKLTLEFVVIFSILTLLMLLLAVWGGFSFANRLVKPIGRLIHAARDVQKGNLSVRVDPTSKVDELENLGVAFNQMIGELDTQTKALVVANHEVESRRRFMETVLEGVSSGVLSLDRKGTIHLANTSGMHFFHAHSNQLIGSTLIAIAPELGHCLEEALKVTSQVFEKQVNLERHGQFYTLRVSVRGGGKTLRKAVDVVMTFDDVTELLGAQRKAAWSDVARLVAHEIKNPLTPIRLSAERLKRRYLKQIQEDPQSFETCLDTIVRQVDSIGKMIGEFSSFARMPQPVMSDNDLVSVCNQALFLQREAFPKIQFQFDPPEAPFWMECDPHQMGQVLTNLLKNAAESVMQRLDADSTFPGQVSLELESGEKDLSIRITDNGLGFPKEGRDRLSEPYITTKSGGTGLGLAIVRKIVEDHGGIVRLQDAKQGPGAQVLISFKKQVESTKIHGT